MKYQNNPYTPASRTFINPGRTEKDTYMLEIAPNGEKKLIKTGVQQIQSEINSHRDLCDVKSIVERFTLSGEADKLSAKGNFVDLTELPKNLAETFDIVKKGKSLFESLKPEIKQYFGSYEDFLANFANAGTANAFLLKYATPKNDKQEVTVDAETEQK